jgi:hypothetical protein
MMNKRELTLSFFFGIGFGTTKNTITVKGEYKFVTKKYIFLFVCLTDTKCYCL